jgi:hypothetical protein
MPLSDVSEHDAEFKHRCHVKITIVIVHQFEEMDCYVVLHSCGDATVSPATPSLNSR